MPGSLFTWYGPRELGALGQRESVLSGEIELNRLKRLAGLLHSDVGTVTATMRFRQESSRWLIIEMEYDTTVQLVCQRCLEPLHHHVRDRVEMVLLETESLEAYSPEGYEPLVLDEDRLMPAILIEDELIISLPIVPRHDRREACGSLAEEVLADD